MTIKQTSAYMANEQVILLYPSLAHTFGVNGALIIQQIRWWMAKYEQSEVHLPPEERTHFHDGRWWIYNSYDEWHKSNFSFWSKRTIERHIANLEKTGAVLSGEFNKATGDRTKWYTLDFDVLDRLVAEKLASIAPRSATDPVPPEPDQPPHPPGAPVGDPPSRQVDVTPSRQSDVTPSRQNDETISSKCRDHHDKLSRSIYKDSEITPEINQQRSHTKPPPTTRESTRGRRARAANGGGGSDSALRKEILKLMADWNIFPDLMAQLQRLDDALLLAMIWSVQAVPRARNPAGLLHKRVTDGWRSDQLIGLAEVAVRHGLVERERAAVYQQAEELGQL